MKHLGFIMLLILLAIKEKNVIKQTFRKTNNSIKAEERAYTLISNKDKITII